MTESIFFDRLKRLLCYSKCETEDVKRLFEAYPGHISLASADFDCIASLADEKSAYMIRILYALAERRITDSFRFGACHSNEEIVRFLKSKFYSKSCEVSYAMLLDSENKVISCEFLGEGTVNFLSVSPRKVLELAIKKRASAVIIAHNHPGGVAKPSCEDIEATRIIANLFETTGRRVLAHYVFAGEHHDVILPTENE